MKTSSSPASKGRFTLTCFATLASYNPGKSDDVPFEEGETLEQLIRRLDIPPDEVRITFVNGRSVPLSTVLQQGDRVGLFPAVGGG